jgi:hypothetical protein
MTFKPIKIWAGRDSLPMRNELPGYPNDPSTYKLFHNSNHKFEPGDIVDPTTTLNQARVNQGMEDEEAEEMAKDNPGRENTPLAWASDNPDYMKTWGRYTYEVEPVTKHSEVEKDPVGWKNDEYAAPEGYRVKQLVWDKQKDSCPTCNGNGGSRSAFSNKCGDCFGTGMSVSRIAGLQKSGYKLHEILKYQAERY